MSLHLLLHLLLRGYSHHSSRSCVCSCILQRVDHHDIILNAGTPLLGTPFPELEGLAPRRRGPGGAGPRRAGGAQSTTQGNSIRTTQKTSESNNKRVQSIMTRPNLSLKRTPIRLEDGEGRWCIQSHAHLKRGRGKSGPTGLLRVQNK